MDLWELRNVAVQSEDVLLFCLLILLCNGCINIHKALQSRLSFGIESITGVTRFRALLQRLNCPCSSSALQIDCARG